VALPFKTTKLSMSLGYLHAVLLAVTSLLWLASSLASAADVVKCRTNTGRVIYSDVPCEKQGAATTGTVDTSPNEVGGVGRPPAQAPGGKSSGPARTLSASADQVPYVNGFIGNRPVRFMVDTGASEISIPYRRAVELGIPVFAGQRAESLTASGRVGIHKIRLASVTVGGVTVRNVAAHISLNDGGSQDVLLGMSFLRHVSLIMRNGAITIGP